MPTAKLEIEYDDIDDLRSILRGLRQREGRKRGRTLNMARLIALASLADAIEQHIHDVTTGRLLPHNADETPSPKATRRTERAANTPGVVEILDSGHRRRGTGGVTGDRRRR